MASVVNLLDVHAAQREELVRRVTQIVLATWKGLGSWNRADIEAFVSRVVPVIHGGQMATASLVDVYVAQVVSELSGAVVAPVGVPPEVATGGRGVPPAEVYTRPFIQLWSDLSKGLRFADAFDAATNRVSELADDDMSLAYRHATVSVMSRRPEVSRYRRVIHPEASKGGSCDLCQIASENTYYSEDLMPIHTHCRCAVVPIVGASDPGDDMNAEDRTITSPVPISIHDHGELGPILYPRGQHFDGPAQIAA